jgi:hypothetical protein
MQIIGAGQQVNMGATPELYGMASQMQQLRSSGEAQNAASRRNSGFMGALGQFVGLLGGGGLGGLFSGGGLSNPTGVSPSQPWNSTPGYFGRGNN